MSTIPDFPPPARALDGTELVPMWQDGQQIAAALALLGPLLAQTPAVKAVLAQAASLLKQTNDASAAAQAATASSVARADADALEADRVLAGLRLLAGQVAANNATAQINIARTAMTIVQTAIAAVSAQSGAANLAPTSGTAAGSEMTINAPAGVPADKAAWVDVFVNGALVTGFTTDGSRTIRLATALKAGDKWFIRQFQSVVGDSGAAPTLAGYAVVLSRGGQSVAAPLAVLRT